MYKLMAVDDEKAMCDVLADIIDWSELGVEFVGYSTNGFDAYEKALEWQPDIIMTDIKMPGMSGIELMKKLTDAGLKSRFLLLTAYAEFEYAREALKYNVKHYLLKPCNEEQIQLAISEICGELVRQKALIQDENAYASDYSESTRKVLRIVEDELANADLSLKWIAEEKLFMNVDYLSKKFSSDTGQRFSVYLTALRMNKAKEMLTSAENNNIYMVAEQIGYGSNTQYFSQVFKKTTGLSPTEYKKKIKS